MTHSLVSCAPTNAPRASNSEKGSDEDGASKPASQPLVLAVGGDRSWGFGCKFDSTQFKN